MTSTGFQIFVALGLDLLFGDPRRLPHPVKLIGRLAAFLEEPSRRLIYDPRMAGTVTALTVIVITVGTTLGIISGARKIDPLFGDFISIVLLYTTIAARDLADHSKNVFRALITGDLPEARRRVARMVGRDTESLDEPGVVRAAVESVAENTVDGVIAPLFWAVLAGPAGAMAYKAVNTLDSTFGYKNKRYARFGWASAKIDDAANWIPARLAVPLLVAAALILRMNPQAAWRIGLRDGQNHASPNSGWSEATVAGALGVKLGGPLYRKGKPEPVPTLGDPLTPLNRGHIGKANALMFTAAGLAVIVFLAMRWMITSIL
jgi:adenosylcobinamide-phosphate synthase